MKELYYKDILGNNPRKREISMEEVSDRTEARVAKKWICKYFVKEKYSSKSLENLKKWIYENKRDSSRRDCHILRRIDTKTGENKVICKVLGDFFVIWRGSVYKIVYVNELRIQIDNGGKF